MFAAPVKVNFGALTHVPLTKQTGLLLVRIFFTRTEPSGAVATSVSVPMKKTFPAPIAFARASASAVVSPKPRVTRVVVSLATTKLATNL